MMGSSTEGKIGNCSRLREAGKDRDTEELPALPAGSSAAELCSLPAGWVERTGSPEEQYVLAHSPVMGLVLHEGFSSSSSFPGVSWLEGDEEGNFTDLLFLLWTTRSLLHLGTDWAVWADWACPQMWPPLHFYWKPSYWYSLCLIQEELLEIQNLENSSCILPITQNNHSSSFPPQDYFFKCLHCHSTQNKTRPSSWGSYQTPGRPTRLCQPGCLQHSTHSPCWPQHTPPWALCTAAGCSTSIVTAILIQT